MALIVTRLALGVLVAVLIVGLIYLSGMRPVVFVQ